jgi:hypothetical protein
MANALQFSSAPLPDDYKDSICDQMIQVLESGKLKPTGDKDKAMKAVFEVVTGTGKATGKENEPLLLLGSDMIARAKVARDFLDSGLEAFGEDYTKMVGVDE